MAIALDLPQTAVAHSAQVGVGGATDMSQVTIDAAKKIGEAIIADAVVEKTTRETLTLRFASAAAREQVSALIGLVGAQRGVEVKA